MEEENVFCKLRRIARSVQNESALAQERMSRPSALRSSGDSAWPVLRRMQCDAHNVKRESEDRASRLPSSAEFSNILDSCSQLCDAYRLKANELEAYLHQYGYQPQQLLKAKSTLPEKKSATPASQATGSYPAEDKITHKSAQEMEESKENIPTTTPQKNPDLASSLKGGTPRLEDFGVSRGFLEMMARNKLQRQEQSRPTSVLEGTSMNSIYTKKDTIDAYTPLRSSSQASTCPFTPLGVTTTPAGVTVTPGLFGGSELPNETPTQFMDMVTGRPPVDGKNSSEGYSHPKKSLHFGPASDRFAPASVLDAIPSHIQYENEANKFGTPPAPEMTARWNFTSIHVPSPKQPDPTPRPDPGEPVPPVNTHLRYQPPITDTPPTPEMTMKWESRSMPAMPVAPERLTANIQHELMEEPVRLTSQIHRHTPEEPQLLLNKYGAPSVDETPETPPGLTGKLGRSKAFDFSRFLSEDMPKTPEMTMSYARYVDPQTKATNPAFEPAAIEVPPISSSGHYPNPPLPNRMDGSYSTLPTTAANVSFAAISQVSGPEFEGQTDYMRRILPLEFINKTVARMNAVLQEKANNGDAVCLTDADIQRLELGAKSKAMLLFLIKLQRVTSGKMTGCSETGYYPAM